MDKKTLRHNRIGLFIAALSLLVATIALIPAFQSSGGTDSGQGNAWPSTPSTRNNDENASCPIGTWRVTYSGTTEKVIFWNEEFYQRPYTEEMVITYGAAERGTLTRHRVTRVVADAERDWVREESWSEEWSFQLTAGNDITYTDAEGTWEERDRGPRVAVTDSEYAPDTFPEIEFCGSADLRLSYGGEQHTAARVLEQD